MGVRMTGYGLLPVAGIFSLFIVVSHGQPVTSVTLRGVAQATGYLQFCPIVFTRGNAIKALPGASAVTNINGSFSITISAAGLVPGDLVGSWLAIVNGSVCKDTGTGLGLPTALGALVDLPVNYTGGPITTVINGITTLAWITKKNVNTPEITRIVPFITGGAAFTAKQFYQTFQTVLQTNNGPLAASQDLIAATKANVPVEAPKVQAFNLQLITSLSLGSSLANGFNNVPKATAAETFIVKFYGVAYTAIFSNQAISLTDAGFLSKILAASTPTLNVAVRNASSLILAQVNINLQSLGTQRGSLTLLGKFAKIMLVVGSTLSNAATALGAGRLTPALATSLYTGQALVNLFTAANPPAKFPSTPRGFDVVAPEVLSTPTEASTVVQTIVIPPGSTSTVTTIVDQSTLSGKPTVTSVIRPVPQTEPTPVVLPMTVDMLGYPEGPARAAKHDAAFKKKMYWDAVKKARMQKMSHAAGGPGEAAAPSAKPAHEMPDALLAALRAHPKMSKPMPIGAAAPEQATPAAAPEQAVPVALPNLAMPVAASDLPTAGAAPSQDVAASVPEVAVASAMPGKQMGDALPPEIAAIVKSYNAMYAAEVVPEAAASPVPESVPAGSDAGPAALPIPVQEVMVAASGTVASVPADAAAAGAPMAADRAWLTRTFAADAELLPVSESVVVSMP